jgi:hypothetical protein
LRNVHDARRQVPNTTAIVADRRSQSPNAQQPHRQPLNVIPINTLLIPCNAHAAGCIQRRAQRQRLLRPTFGRAASFAALTRS